MDYEEYKEEVLDKLLGSDFDKKRVVFDFFMRMQVKKENSMVKMLNILDELSEDCEKRRQMRDLILDNMNDLPRDTLKMIEKLIT